MFKVNNKDTRTILVSLLLTLNIFTPCSSVSIVNFGEVNGGWDIILFSFTVNWSEFLSFFSDPWKYVFGFWGTFIETFLFCQLANFMFKVNKKLDSFLALFKVDKKTGATSFCSFEYIQRTFFQFLG